MRGIILDKFKREWQKNKKTLLVFLILQVLIILFALRAAFAQQWEVLFTCVLAFLLLFLPSLAEHSFRILLPTALEITVYFFVFCSAVLGEVGDYYRRFAVWDSMLHAVNGFVFAAFGFCLVDVLEKSSRTKFRLSPLFLALVAFCFSMTIGVFWEFFEFAADRMLGTDMQKDMFLSSIHTVSLSNAYGEKVTHIKDISGTVLVSADGSTVTYGGFLDIGLFDTVKDLFVNFLGALLFSVIGFFYVRKRKGGIARQFIPIFVGDEKDH